MFPTMAIGVFVNVNVNCCCVAVTFMNCEAGGEDVLMTGGCGVVTVNLAELEEAPAGFVAIALKSVAVKYVPWVIVI
jgi:hypothetical protein